MRARTSITVFLRQLNLSRMSKLSARLAVAVQRIADSILIRDKYLYDLQVSNSSSLVVCLSEFNCLLKHS